jgi:hypothetical protein
MTTPSSFKHGKKYPVLGINNPNISTWVRWGLPIGTGLAVAVIILHLI